MVKAKHKIKLNNLIFLYVVTTIIVTTISLSKFVTTTTSNSITKVALMASSASVNLDLSDGVFPGYENIFPIEMSNKKDGKTCEVTQQFTIQINREENENLPLTYELYKDEACTEIIGKDENGNYSAQEFKFSAGIEETKKYYLKISWPENENNIEYAFEIGYFTIDIIATQID